MKIVRKIPKISMMFLEKNPRIARYLKSLEDEKQITFKEYLLILWGFSLVLTEVIVIDENYFEILLKESQKEPFFAASVCATLEEQYHLTKNEFFLTQTTAIYNLYKSCLHMGHEEEEALNFLDKWMFFAYLFYGIIYNDVLKKT